MLLDGVLRLLNPRSQPAFHFGNRLEGIRMRSVCSLRLFARSFEALAPLLESGRVVLGQVTRAIAQRGLDRSRELRGLLFEPRDVALQLQRSGARRYQDA